MKLLRHIKIRTICFIFGVGLILFLTLHYAIGQRMAREEKIRDLMEEAGQVFKSKNYPKANEILLQAESLLPQETPETPLAEGLKKLTDEVKFNLALSHLKVGQLEEADELLMHLVQNPKTSIPSEKCHEAYAMSRYYRAWNLRLESADRSEWAPMANEAREHFRLLSEAPVATELDAKNLEKATRLMTLHLTALKKLPLPEEVEASQRADGKNKDGKKQKQKSDSGNKQKRPHQGDIRDKDKIDPQGSAGAPDLRGR